MQVSWPHTLTSPPPAASVTHCRCSSRQLRWRTGRPVQPLRCNNPCWLSKLTPHPCSLSREAYGTSLEEWAVHGGVRTCSLDPTAGFYGGVWPAGVLLERKGLLIALLCLCFITGTGARLHRKQHARQACRPSWKLQQLG